MGYINLAQVLNDNGIAYQFNVPGRCHESSIPSPGITLGIQTQKTLYLHTKEKIRLLTMLYFCLN